MRNTLTSRESEIIFERNEESMGIYYNGPIPPTDLDPKFQEAYDLLSGLIEYIEEGEDPRSVYEKSFINVNVPLMSLPENTPSWIISETPYTWKGRVIVSQESLRYYEDLRHKLISAAGKEKSELSQIVYFRRAACCKDIIHGLQKKLG